MFDGCIMTNILIPSRKKIAVFISDHSTSKTSNKLDAHSVAFCKQQVTTKFDTQNAFHVPNCNSGNIWKSDVR